MKPIKVLVALLTCFVLIFLDLNFQFSNLIRGYSKDIFQPIFSLREIPLEIIIDIENFLLSKKETMNRLRDLEEENKKLMLVNSLLEEFSKENKQLKSLWSIDQKNKDSYVLAKKRYLSSNSLRPLLTLELERGDYLEGQKKAVFSNSGIIGRVVSQGLYNAEVMLVQDPRSSIPVISSISRLHGMVQGRGLGRLGKLINIKKTADFQEGEVLLSSGLGNIFPSGFYVAKINSISDEPDNEFLDINVTFISFPESEDFFLVFIDKY